MIGICSRFARSNHSTKCSSRIGKCFFLSFSALRLYCRHLLLATYHSPQECRSAEVEIGFPCSTASTGFASERCQSTCILRKDSPNTAKELSACCGFNFFLQMSFRSAILRARRLLTPLNCASEEGTMVTGNRVGWI